MLAFLSASAALLAPVNTNTCREQPRSRAVIMQADRRSVLAAAACLVVPTKAWAGYALGAAAVAEHSTVATGKEKEKAVLSTPRRKVFVGRKGHVPSAMVHTRRRRNAQMKSPRRSQGMITRIIKITYAASSISLTIACHATVRVTTAEIT